MGAVNTHRISYHRQASELLKGKHGSARLAHKGWYIRTFFGTGIPVLCMLLILQLLQPVIARAQPQGKEITGNFKHFELDKLGNLFLIGPNGSQFTQYNKHGDSINHYDNISSYGQITSLDVSNPLKLAVYYRDFGTIVVLDRFLSPVNTIDLKKAGIWDAQTVATSYDNQYWVYDKQEARIKKVNGQSKVTFASSDLRQVFDNGLDPVRLLDRDGLLYAYDPTYGWYIFDYYGALKQKIPIKDLRDVSVTDGILTARMETAGGSRIWLMNPERPLTDPVQINLPDSAVKTGRTVQKGKTDTIRQSLFLGTTGELLLLTPSGLNRLLIGKP